MSYFFPNQQGLFTDTGTYVFFRECQKHHNTVQYVRRVRLTEQRIQIIQTYSNDHSVDSRDLLR